MRHRRVRRGWIVLLLAAACGETPPETPPPDETTPLIAPTEHLRLMESRRLLWEVAARGRYQELLAADGGRLWYRDDATLVCLNTADGREQWRREELGWVVPDGDRLIATEGPVAQPRAILALDPATGKELWRREVEFDTLHALSALDGRVLLLVDAGQDYEFRSFEPRLLILDEADGRELRSRPMNPAELYRLGDGLYHSREELARLDPQTGNVLWHYQYPVRRHQQAALIGESLYLLTPERLYIVQAATGTELVRRELALREGLLIPAGGLLVTAAAGRALGLDPATGADRWSLPLPETLIAAVAAADDRWYYLGSYPSNLPGWGYVDPLIREYQPGMSDLDVQPLIYALSCRRAADGAELWRLEADFPLTGLLAAKGRLYLTAADGRLLCLVPD